MAVLVITRTRDRKPLIVEFDPAKESQADVEARHGVSFSEYFESRGSAEVAMASRQPDTF
jgi:hypothetical protein